MKPIVTNKTSLLKETVDKINDQIRMEGESSQFYLSCASWCETKGYLNASAFMYGHSDEERMHMLKLMRYTNQAGGHALAPHIKNVPHQFESLLSIFQNVLEHEIKVTNAINDLVDHAFKVKDFATFQFLQWFIIEQREEEELARRVLEIFDIIGLEGQGLWLIEQEIGKLSARASGKAEAPADGEAA